MTSEWYWIIGIYISIAIITASAFYRGAGPHHNKIGFAVCVVLGMFWPLTVLIVFGMELNS